MTEQKRRETNAARLLELNVDFRAKVRAVIDDLERKGERPFIATGFRSIAEQSKKKAHGFSKVSYGLHNCQTRDGKPESLAADIVDAEDLWNAKRSFWLKLASSATAHGLESGIFWGLKQAQRNAIRDSIHQHDFTKALAVGWDVAHIQWAGISPLQARLGKRPKA